MKIEGDTRQRSVNSKVALLGLLCDSDQFCPLLFLHVFMNYKKEHEEWNVFAVSRNGKVCLWSLTRPRLSLDESKQSFASEVGKLIATHSMLDSEKATCAT